MGRDSHSNLIVITVDMPFRYMPYKLFNLIKKMV